MKDIVMIYQKLMLVSFLVFSFSYTPHIIGNNEEESQEKSKAIQEKLYKIFTVGDSDSLILQECKQILIDKDVNNPLLVSACGTLAQQLKAYKKGNKKSYKEYISKLQNQTGKTEKFIEGAVHQKYHENWEQKKVDITRVEDAQKELLNFYHSFNNLVTLQGDQEKKLFFSSFKQWMNDSNLESIEYVTCIVCCALSKTEYTENEIKKLIEIFKKYKNK